MGVTLFNGVILAVGGVLVLAGVLDWMLRARRGDRDEQLLLILSPLSLFLGLVALVSAVVGIAVPGVHCAAC